MTLHSMANFWVGEVLTLRPDMGGGRWRVIRWWRAGDFCHADVVPA